MNTEPDIQFYHPKAGNFSGTLLTVINPPERMSKSSYVTHVEWRLQYLYRRVGQKIWNRILWERLYEPGLEYARSARDPESLLYDDTVRQLINILVGAAFEEEEILRDRDLKLIRSKRIVKTPRKELDFAMQQLAYSIHDSY